MTDRSSTSSSEAPERIKPAGPARNPRALIRRLPGGLLWVLVFVLLGHWVGISYFSHPVAPETLRRRTRTLTATARPSLVLGGDSRIHTGLVPAVLAEELGLPPPQVVNIASSAGDSTRLWCLYREFSSRFAPRPVVLLGVSLFSVNDGAGIIPCDELLWSVSFNERRQIAPPSRAITSCFFAERALWNACTSPDWLGSRIAAHNEDPRRYEGQDLVRWGADDRREAAAMIQDQWYKAPRLDGVRWMQLQRNSQALVRAGVQLVIVDPPRHPDLERLIGSQDQETGRRFRGQLVELTERLRLPLLTCQPDWYGDANPDLLFGDLVHLNGPGAREYSRWIASRLRELNAAGLVQLESHRPTLADAVAWPSDRCR